jgi:hypothetical protein
VRLAEAVGKVSAREGAGQCRRLVACGGIRQHATTDVLQVDGARHALSTPLCFPGAHEAVGAAMREGRVAVEHGDGDGRSDAQFACTDQCQSFHDQLLEREQSCVVEESLARDEMHFAPLENGLRSVLPPMHGRQTIVDGGGDEVLQVERQHHMHLALAFQQLLHEQNLAAA